MNFLVLNGSPKGDLSITMYYIKYLQKIHPEHNFEIINVAQQINKIENDENYFNEILDKVEKCDCVVWGFPLYVTVAHANYHRFFELIFEKNKMQVFNGKYCTAVSTSIHFFDHTAHNFIRAVSHDLNMKYIDYYSAKMRDLMDEKERKKFKQFWENVISSVKNDVYLPNIFPKVEKNDFVYEPERSNKKVKAGNKKIIVLTDSESVNSNLSKMVEKFKICIDGDIETINIHDIDIKGGCQGCCVCGYNNTCIYEGKDGLIPLFKQKLIPADVIIFASQIKTRYLSYRWRTFFDRMFFNTHTPTFVSKQLGFLFSGPFKSTPNIRESITGIMQWQNSNITGFICDDIADSNELDAQIYNLAFRSIENSKVNYIRPKTFPGVGGVKVFRDDIYGGLKFPFVADHKYYKKHGVYDFPKKSLLISFLLTMLKIFPGLRKKIFTPKSFKNAMTRNLEKFIKKI